MATFRDVGDSDGGSLKLEQVWWPFVSQGIVKLNRRDESQILPVVGFDWPERYSLEFLSIKLTEDPEDRWDVDSLQIKLKVFPAQDKSYYSAPIGSMKHDPFGFYVEWFPSGSHIWIPPQGGAVVELTNMGDETQSGKIMVKLDGLLFRKIV